jgi:hypothetical protein
MKIKGLDKGIRPAVEILQKGGFETTESCEGGDGHCYSEPTVRFLGSEFDLFKAYQHCEQNKLNVDCVRRVFCKEIWDKLFNEITFKVHPKTGTIFVP